MIAMKSSDSTMCRPISGIINDAGMGCIWLTIGAQDMEGKMHVT
jgi:hypothetical protein